MKITRPQLVAIAVALSGLVVSGCSDYPTELTFAQPSAPADHGIVTELVDLFDDEAGISLHLTEETYTGEQALDAVLSGAADVALVSNALPFREGIATIIPLYPTVLHIAYVGNRNTTDVFSLIEGAKIFAGDVGSGSRFIFEQSLQRTGISPNDFEYVDSVEDANVVVLFAPVSPERLRNFPQVRLFSLGDIDSVGQGGNIDSATFLNPHLEPFVIPANTYGPVTPEPILTLAVDKMLVTRHDMSPNSVYAMIYKLLRLRPALAAKRPGVFNRLTGDFDPGNSTFVLHPGAQAFLHRDEPSVYERYSGVAEVGVTVMIAIFSAILGGVKLYRVRRKNRIDSYYSSVIDIRNEAASTTDEEKRESLAVDIRRLQDKAFDELVKERLAADESFRIFVSLSNDVLRQLGARDQLSPVVED